MSLRVGTDGRGKLTDKGYLADGVAVPEGVQRFYLPVESDEDEEDEDAGDERGCTASPVKQPQPVVMVKAEPTSPIKALNPLKAEAVAADGSMGPTATADADGDVEMTDVEKEAETDAEKIAPKDATASSAVKAEAKDAEAAGSLPTPPPSPPFYLRVDYRPRSPDMTWLPPLPTADVELGAATGVPGAGAEAGAEVAAEAPAPQSIVDRYRQPVPYSTSQLVEAHPFCDPPQSTLEDDLPSAPSSFPTLVAAYEAALTEPSVALRQTDGRRQAADLLRLTVGNPDRFSTRDTLAHPLPGPQVSAVVPSHSETLPPHLIPVNPDQAGIITSILHQIRTPYLPAGLRERLTSLRPPQAQMTERGPALFGDPVRGADDAALAKARGKATGEDSIAEFRATWDSGPHGPEKWSRGRLPTGRKVIKEVVGSAPREPGAPSNPKAPLRLKIAGAETTSPGALQAAAPAASPQPMLKLRLGAKPPGNATSPLASGELATSPAATTLRLSAPRSVSPKKRSLSPKKRVKQEPMQVD
jgi:hypothetical protein